MISSKILGDPNDHYTIPPRSAGTLSLEPQLSAGDTSDQQGHFPGPRPSDGLFSETPVISRQFYGKAEIWETLSGTAVISVKISRTPGPQ